MSEMVRGFNFSYYPKDEEVQEALDTLKPIGILSKVRAFNENLTVKRAFPLKLELARHKLKQSLN